MVRFYIDFDLTHTVPISSQGEMKEHVLVTVVYLDEFLFPKGTKCYCVTPHPAILVCFAIITYIMTVNFIQ